MEKATKLLLALLLTAGMPAVYADENTVHKDQKSIAAIPELDCIIEPSEIVDLGTAVSGLIKSIDIDRSDQVEKGRVVVQLESSVEQASVNLASARAKIETAIELRQANLKLGYITQSRSKELLQNAAISAHEMDQVKTDIRVAELNLKQEQENKIIAGMDLKRAMVLLQQRKIQSPVNGVVMQRFKSVGEYVDNDPILRIAKLDPLHVEVIVPVNYMGTILPGMEADINPVVGDSNTYRAKVERVDQVVDASSGTFGVQLSIPNPDYQISAGLRCTANIFPKNKGLGQEIALSAWLAR